MSIVPKKFNIWINLRHALINGASMFLFLKIVLAVSDPTLLSVGVLFGLCGGSLAELTSFLRNKDAITAYDKDQIATIKDTTNDKS